MRWVALVLAIVLLFFFIGFIAWLTEGSPAALLAAFLLLVVMAIFGAEKAGFLQTPQAVKTLAGFVGMICISIILWVWGANYVGEKRAEARAKREQAIAEAEWKAKIEAAAAASKNPVQTNNTGLPAVIYAKTPISLPLDFVFNVESDGPLMMQNPGEKPVLLDGKQQVLPPPKKHGPKVFTRPENSKEEVFFRIYPLRPYS